MHCMSSNHTNTTNQKQPSVVSSLSRDDSIPSLEESDVINRRVAAIEVVCRCGLALKYVDEEWRFDKAVVTSAISNDGRALVYASQSLKDDEDVVTLAVGNQWAALKHASLRLKDNKEIVTVALANNGGALQYASARLRADPDLVALAVNTCGMALEFASDRLRNDRAIVSAAIAADPRAFAHASAELQHDETIAFAAGQKDVVRRHVIDRVTHYGLQLQEERDEWRADKQVVTAAVHNQGLALGFASPYLKNDYDVVMAAIHNDSNSLKYASETLQNNPCIVKAAVTNVGRTLQYASPQLQDNKDIVRVAVSQDGDSLRYASPQLKRSYHIVTLAVNQDPHSLVYAHEELRSDSTLFRLYAIARVSLRGTEIKNFDDQWKADKDIVKAAVRNDWTALKYASQELRSDKVFIADILKREGSALQYATKELRSDKDTVLTAVKSRPEALKFAFGGLNEDPECLVAAGLWDASYGSSANTKTKQIFLSMKLSLDHDEIISHTTTEHAATFLTKLKHHPFFKKCSFFCPDLYTSSSNQESIYTAPPCQDILDGCENKDGSSTGVSRHEKATYWKDVARFYLKQGRDTDGFMVQVVEVDEKVEDHVLEDNQKIELEIAKAVGIKIFRVYQDIYFGDISPFDDYHVARLVERVKSWNHGNCADMNDSEIKLMKHYSI